MVRQAFDLLGHPVPGERLQGLDNAGVQHPPPLLEQTAIGDLVRQGMLEGVFVLGKQACLVQELGRLQVRQAAVQGLLGQLGNSLQQGQGYLRANDRGGLEEALLLRRQAVDARRQHRLHRGRHLHARRGLCQAIGPRLPDQHPGLHQGAHALLQEEGIALGARDQQLLERVGRRLARRPPAGPARTPRRWPAAAGRAAVACSRSCCPSRAGTPDDSSPAAGAAPWAGSPPGCRAGLGLGIDPVQVFEDQQQGLYLAFAQQHALEGVQRALAPLRRVELQERAVLWQGVQERQQRREGVLERLVQRQHLPGHLGADGARSSLSSTWQ